MSIIEVLKKQERQQSILEGIEKAKKAERAKAHAEILKSALEFKKMGIPVADIAKGLQLSIEEIEKQK